MYFVHYKVLVRFIVCALVGVGLSFMGISQAKQNDQDNRESAKVHHEGKSARPPNLDHRKLSDMDTSFGLVSLDSENVENNEASENLVEVGDILTDTKNTIERNRAKCEQAKREGKALVEHPL